jgi:hypothetical protein
MDEFLLFEGRALTAPEVLAIAQADSTPNNMLSLTISLSFDTGTDLVKDSSCGGVTKYKHFRLYVSETYATAPADMTGPPWSRVIVGSLKLFNEGMQEVDCSTSTAAASSVSTENSGANDAAKAFDASAETSWWSASNTNEWIQIYFPEAKDIAHFQIFQSSVPSSRSSYPSFYSTPAHGGKNLILHRL